jgi:hypothetical protein
MAHLLTPPPEGPPKIDDEREKLVTRLDELLELYLELLDEYIRTREQASSYFSSVAIRWSKALLLNSAYMK